jgi:AAA+ ATPase superfamily predicted ATPase
MLDNPFTPSEIASGADEFFGRQEELRLLERAVRQGSVVIQGGIGIGKSSLLARVILLMEGFGSAHNARSVIAVGNRDVRTGDDAARLILEGFVRVDEQSSKISFKIGSLVEIESGELCRFFKEGRHLAALKRMIEDDYLPRVFSNNEYLLLAIDEADKCPRP